ncbi:MAG: hypothetical protein HZA60_01795 [Deltaproteobacteria bacterium]|nr:hypothetical protein [Deltaproteobacteria bacterium]
MEEILSRVRKTLGEDALILSSRKLPRKRLGAFTESVYEVSAAVDRIGGPAAPAGEPPPPVLAPRPGTAAAGPAPFEAFLSLEKELGPLKEEIATVKSFLSMMAEEREKTAAPGRRDRLDTLVEDVRSLHKLLESAASGLVPQPAVPASGLAPPRPAAQETTGAAPPPENTDSADWLVRRLLAQGVEPGACHRIRETVLSRCSRSAGLALADIRREAGAVIESAIRVMDIPAPPAAGPRILAFIGPSGSGKTVTVARAAALLSRKGFRCAAISSGDDAAGNVLLASRLQRRHGIPTLWARSGEELSRAVAHCFGAHYILIDVAGRTCNDRASMQEVMAAFGGRTDIDFCLTLPASWGGTRADRLVRNYAPLPVHCLAFAKLDETDRYGAMFNAAAFSGRPVAFMTAGRRSPGEIFPARPYMFSRLLLDKPAS